MKIKIIWLYCEHLQHLLSNWCFLDFAGAFSICMCLLKLQRLELSATIQMAFAKKCGLTLSSMYDLCERLLQKSNAAESRSMAALWIPPTQRNSWPSGAWSIMNAVYTLISTVCSQGSSGGQKLIQNMVGKIHTNLVLIKTLVLYATFYSIILHIWQAFVSKCVYNLLNYLKSSN